MTVLRADTLKLNATATRHSVPTLQPETYGTPRTQRTDVTVSLKVDDARIRQQVDGFDGRERPFVMLPSVSANGSVSWWRHDLSYRGEGLDGYISTRKVDVYDLGRVQNVDAAAVKKYGVVVGLDTNVGTLWAQKPNENLAVEWK